MGKVRQLAERLNALDFESMCAQTLVENEQHITDLNTQQLFQGERADGTIMPDYSFVSVNFFNKPPGPIKLYDTGDFYGGFKLGGSSFPMQIISTDSKSEELKSRYGKEIFGLTEENMAGLARVFIIPQIIKKLRQLIQL